MHFRTFLLLALTLLVPSRALAQMEAVDLGLSVKWASCNLGASKPGDAGKFYAWGETQSKSVFSDSNYALYKPGPGGNTGNPFALAFLLKKYCTDVKISSAPGVYGDVDGKTVLEPQDDAARKELGAKWRIPTTAERDELRSQCDWKWTKEGGVPGYRVTSKKNGNSIFLPAAGYYKDEYRYRAGEMGFYWTANIPDEYPFRAYYLGFNDSTFSTSWWGRTGGFTIRPVTQ